MIRTTNTRGGILKVKRSYKYNRSCVCVCVCVFCPVFCVKSIRLGSCWTAPISITGISDFLPCACPSF